MGWLRVRGRDHFSLEGLCEIGVGKDDGMMIQHWSLCHFGVYKGSGGFVVASMASQLLVYRLEGVGGGSRMIMGMLSGTGDIGAGTVCNAANYTCTL